MRAPLLLAAALSAATGCSSRATPYRFSMPMLGAADVPPARLDRASEADRAVAPIEAVTHRPRPRPRPRVASIPARPIELPRVVSAARPIHEPADLRSLVGTRDKRPPLAVTLGWLGDLGITAFATDGPSLVAWAESRGELLPPTEPARPGDLLVFDRAVADAPADLVAIAIGRDTRGVTEFVYAGGGVVRRGFLVVAQPSIRRDANGAVLNTFLRHGKQWPPKGTRYLAGELLTHVIRTH
jgi:hypothetical protein